MLTQQTKIIISDIIKPIQFADQEVKRRCIKAGWDINGDGEISYAEAALVSDIGEVFEEGNPDDFRGQRIESFEECQFFVGLKEIRDFAFAGCLNLKSIILPNTITHIGEYAFSTSGLEYISLPESLISIGECAFEYTNLSSINLPLSIIEIGIGPFRGCNKLHRFESKYSLDDGRCLIIGDTMVAFAPCGLDEYHVPERASHIGPEVFENIDNLSLYLPPTFKSFYHGFPWQSIHNCGGTLYINSDLEGNAGFLDSFKTIIYGPNVTSVNNTMAGNHYLENVIFETPEKIKSIHSHAFSHCSSLKRLSIPKNVISIGECAFEYCGLESIVLPPSLTSLEKGLFIGCHELRAISIPDNVCVIGENAFEDCSALQTVQLPKSLKYIKKFAFADCENLSSIKFPNRLEVIGDNTFYGCGKIKDVIISPFVKIIGERAFEGCSSIESLNFSDFSHDIQIGKSAFNGCIKLSTTNITNRDLLERYIKGDVFSSDIEYMGRCPILIKFERERIIDRIKANGPFDDIPQEVEDRRWMIEDGLNEAFNGDSSAKWNVD